MLVFFDAGLVLLATPKTGTQSREQCLIGRASIAIRNPPGLKHLTALGFRRKIRPLIDPQKSKKFEIVAVVREPVEWLGSWYRYRKRDGIGNPQNSTREVSFNQFVDAYLQETPPSFAKVGRQVSYVTNGQGNIIADRLFAYDDLKRLDTYLSDKLQCPVEPGWYNKSPTEDLVLSGDRQLKLRKRISADFELYDMVQTTQTGNQHLKRELLVQ